MARDNKLTPQTIERLREIGKRKRQENPRARDYTPDDWAVACDAVKEESGLGWDDDEKVLNGGADGRSCPIARLRYIKGEVIERLASLLPRRYVRLRAHPMMGGSRVVVLFRAKTLLAVLSWLRLEHARNRRGCPTYYVEITGSWYQRVMKKGSIHKEWHS